MIFLPAISRRYVIVPAVECFAINHSYNWLTLLSYNLLFSAYEFSNSSQ